MYIPNGSGLCVPPDPTRNPRYFSVLDGTGYTPRLRCKKTGFALVDDRVIYPDPVTSNWTTTAGSFWTAPPFKFDTTNSGAVATYMPALAAVGDQWCFSTITQLTPVAGVGIGVIVRFNGGNAGYYGQGVILSDDVTHRLELGVFTSGTQQILANTSSWNMVTNPAILLTAIGSGSSIILSLYSGTMVDFVQNTMTLQLQFNPISNLYSTGIPAAVGDCGGNGVSHSIGVQTNWLGGIIGGC